MEWLSGYVAYDEGETFSLNGAKFNMTKIKKASNIKEDYPVEWFFFGWITCDVIKPIGFTIGSAVEDAGSSFVFKISI